MAPLIRLPGCRDDDGLDAELSDLAPAAGGIPPVLPQTCIRISPFRIVRATSPSIFWAMLHPRANPGKDAGVLERRGVGRSLPG